MKIKKYHIHNWMKNFSLLFIFYSLFISTAFSGSIHSNQVNPDIQTIRLWMDQILKGEDSPTLNEFYQHENTLIENRISAQALSEIDIAPKKLMKPTRTSASINTALGRTFSGSNLVRRSNKLYKKEIVPLIQEYYPELLTEKYKDVQKSIQQDLTRNFYFTEWTRQLHGSEVNEKARLYLSVAHPIYDAIFDKDLEGYDIYDLQEKLVRTTQIIMRDYALPPPLLKTEQLLIEIVKRLEESIPEINKDKYFHYLLKLNFAQVESVKQRKKGLDAEELRRIEFRKGGYSMHVYILFADRNFSQEEMDLYFIEGAMLQIIDDCLDIHTDQKEGIETLPLRALVTPQDIWKMSHLLFLDLEKLVEQGEYNKTKVQQYYYNLGVFQNLATKKYKEYLANQSGVPVKIQPHKKVIKFLGKPFVKVFKGVVSVPFPILDEIK